MLNDSVSTWLAAVTLALAALACDSAQPSADGSGGTIDPPTPSESILDIADLDTVDDLFRVHAYTGRGDLGLPVAAGGDCDGDGYADVALASFLASPFDRLRAGEAYLVFGAGTTTGEIDTASPSAKVLRIAGAGPEESLGNEIWIDDVTGDGIADLLVCRQNFRPDPSRPGAGALTILAGGQHLRDTAQSLATVDLESPPGELVITTIFGAHPVDRLGIWVRTADVTGDGTLDIVVGADQEDARGENSGAAYVIRGGPHLATGETIDLAEFGSTPLAGNLARILPPANADGYHFGATCDAADLDGNDRAEVLVAATLNRAGAGLVALGAEDDIAEATGGTPNGTVFILWDDNFPATSWPTEFTVDLEDVPGSLTTIDGSDRHRSFGEELNGGTDFDADGAADLFVGDLAGDLAAETRSQSGVGHVFYDAASLRGRDLDLDALPTDIALTTILGAAAGYLSSDTTIVGDFDGDGTGDLATGSPKANPNGRPIAGTIHVLFGQPGGWPAVIDLQNLDEIDESEVVITTIVGAKGTEGDDRGDMICYSAAGGDIDGDGREDIVTNEMLGNGVAPSAIDVGNLIVINGGQLRSP